MGEKAALRPVKTEEHRTQSSPPLPVFASARGSNAPPSRMSLARAPSRAKVEISQGVLNQIIRQWQGEIQNFASDGSYEDIVGKNVNFLASVNEQTPRLSAKDLQK